MYIQDLQKYVFKNIFNGNFLCVFFTTRISLRVFSGEGGGIF